MMGSYFPDEYLRLSRVTDRWYKIVIFLVILSIFAFTALFTVIFYQLCSAFYSLLHLPGKWYVHAEPVFMLPAIFIAMPLAFLFSIKAIKLFTPYDYKGIVDLLNVRYKFDSEAAFTWFLKVMALITIVPLLMVSWSYVEIQDDGVTIKTSLSFTSQHFNFNDIKRVIHYKYAVDDKNVIYPNDYYGIYLRDGRDLYYIAPSVEDVHGYQTEIINTGHLNVEDGGTNVPPSRNRSH